MPNNLNIINKEVKLWEGRAGYKLRVKMLKRGDDERESRKDRIAQCWEGVCAQEFRIHFGSQNSQGEFYEQSHPINYFLWTKCLCDPINWENSIIL